MNQGKPDFRAVLVTRPAHQAAALMTALKLRGYAGIAAPVLEMHPTDLAIPDGAFDALVFTSANAVTVFAARDARREIDVFAVGSATAGAARKAQFARVISGEGGAVDLAGIMRERLAAGSRVLHLSGRDVAAELAPLLAEAGIGVTRVALYAMEPLAALPVEAVDAVARGGSVLLHSVRSASAFGALAGDLSRMTAICQSAAIAEAARPFGFRTVLTSAAPSEAAMLDCLEAVKGGA